MSTRRQHGQSMIEFIVATAVVVPLFLLVPLLGKYLDIKQTSIAASRKLAFECTVRYEDCGALNANPSLADEIRMRFYTGNSTDVLSNDRPAADVIDNGEGSPLWVDRQNRPLLERFSDVGIRTDASNIDPGVAGVANVPGIDVGPGRFGLDLRRGLYDARVQVRLGRERGGSNFLDQLDSLALTMQFHTAILTDAWAARGPGSGGDTCNPGRGTVVGRTSHGSLCYGALRALDNSAYLAARLLVTPLAIMESNNISEFDFHDFMDAEFADDVPTGDYSRLEDPR
jgi:hypothetical protein